MSEEYISNITLECLMNRDQYKRYKTQHVKNASTLYRKEMKFYKRRIYNLTKQLIQTEDPITHLPDDIKQSFRVFSESCIEHFKMQDKSDILQEGFIENVVIDASDQEVPFVEGIEDMNQVLLRSIKIREENSLERLVKRTAIINPSTMILPQEKELNLNDPSLKNKGICKKKNINNTYDGKK
jgi:hypothetical protein